MLAIQAEKGEGSGHPSKPQPPPSTAQPTHEEPIPNVVSSSHQKTQIPRQALNQVTKLPQTSEAIPNVQMRLSMRSGMTENCVQVVVRCQKPWGVPLQARSERVPTPPYDSPLPRVHTLGSDEGREDQPEDQLGVLSAAKILADAAKTNVHTYTRRRRVVSTSSGGISTASRLFSTTEESVSTAGMVQEINISIPLPVVIKDKGKGKMKESEDEQIKRTKLQQEQDRLGHEAAVRLQEELDEEERQRMARVHEAAQSFTEEEWENIRARVKVVKHIRRLQANERNKYSEVDQAKMLWKFQAIIIDSAEVGSSKRAAEAELDHEGSKRRKTNEASGSVQEQPEEEEKELSQEDLQQMMMVVPVEEVYVEALQVKYPIIGWHVYTEESRKYWKIIRNLVKERFSSTEPTDDKERTLWVELKREEEQIIFMLVEKYISLHKGVDLLLVNKMLVEQHSEMANDLLSKIIHTSEQQYNKVFEASSQHRWFLIQTKLVRFKVIFDKEKPESS
ncbi:hypothetical protein Tco_0994886 [Tanacetum coccineum]